MEHPYETRIDGEAADQELHIYRFSSRSSSAKISQPQFDLRVFYVRLSNLQVDDLTPQFLTLNHTPLTPYTHLDINGVRSSKYSEGVSSLLRRDRVDKKSEEATFVSTDNVRLTGSLKFEVFDEDDLILSGVLEMPRTNGGFIGESTSKAKKWSMNCAAGAGFLNGRLVAGEEPVSPTIEVYVAGSFSEKPIILTKTLQLSFRRKHCQKQVLDAIPEHETTECQKVSSSEYDLQVAEYRNYRQETENDYDNMDWRRDSIIDGEDGELTWFNSGVRVGVGIGLGICLGVGVGVSLLARTYQAAARTFKRQLM